MTDPLDGAIGEAWAGEVPNGSHVNLVFARRGSPTAAAAAGALASPRPGHAPFLACLAAGTPVRPATIVVNKSTIDETRLRRPHLGRGAARHRPGRARRRGRGAARRRARRPTSCCWSRCGSIPPPHDETAVEAANREAIRGAIADAAAAALGRHGARARRPARGGDERLLRRGLSVRITGVEVRRYALRARPAVPRGVGPGAARRDGGEPRDRALRRGARGLRERRRAARRRAARAAARSGSTRCAPRSCASCARPSTSTAGGRGRPRSRSGTSRRGALDEPLWRLLGGRSERLLAYASSGELVEPDERARRVAALRDAGVRAVKLRFHHADWRARRRGGRAGARRGRDRTSS